MPDRRFEVTALPLGDFTFGPDDPWPGQGGLVVGYAIRHDAGVFLFDTGFVLADAEDPEVSEFYGKYRVRPRPVLDALDARTPRSRRLRPDDN